MTETSGHLPECECYGRNHGGCALCICDRLRACEQRVRQSAATLWDRTSEQMAAARVEGIRAGLDAARKAVVALKPWLKVEKYKGGYDCCGCSTTYDLMRDALAAIDALREEKP
ncbi:MAG: hypothetical protein KGN78_05510 [Actinomycetales bacterium]|nr:hypothetical protein [Actinomycetales bacterium]